MKHLLSSLIIGLVAAITLLAAGFFLPEQPGLTWLGQLAYGPSDHLFSYAIRSGLLGPGELRHHSFVLLVSLISWWCAFTSVAYIFHNRRN
jgi:hypothetical protein